MTTGILGSVNEEIALLRQQMRIESVVTVGGIRFTTGRLRGKSVVIGASGVGKVNAALAAQTLIDRFQRPAYSRYGHGRRDTADPAHWRCYFINQNTAV